VADVGGGTGFCTLGVVKTVDAKNVTLIDQSPHQLAKAKAKPALKDVTILEVTPPPPNPTPKIVSRSSSPTSRVEGRDALWWQKAWLTEADGIILACCAMAPGSLFCTGPLPVIVTLKAGHKDP